MMNWKDCAKFMSGASFVALLVRVMIALSGKLPLHIFGMTMTTMMNSACIVLWAVVFAVSTYYAWMKKEKKRWFHFFR